MSPRWLFNALFASPTNCWPWDHDWFLSSDGLGPYGTGRLYRCHKCPATKARG